MNIINKSEETCRACDNNRLAWQRGEQEIRSSQRTPEVIVSNGGDEVRDFCSYTPCYCVLHTAVRMFSRQWNAENVAMCIFESVKSCKLSINMGFLQ